MCVRLRRTMSTQPRIESKQVHSRRLTAARKITIIIGKNRQKTSSWREHRRRRRQLPPPPQRHSHRFHGKN